MMLHFLNLPEELTNGIEHIKKVLDFECGFGGTEVFVKKTGGIVIEKYGSKASIEYGTRVQFFRALGILLQNIRLDSFFHRENTFLRTNGVMLDMSRGGVMHINGICEYLDYMAAMGMNMLMLYTEDLYEIEDRPYFGYMRGRYSREELKQCDDYAFDYGIEIIPCIQCYSHMEQYLHWEEALDISDTSRTMLADADETYNFIEQMIISASSPFRSDRIHIGLDESQDMLTGNYIKRFGYSDDYGGVFRRHAERVVAICRKHGLRPMMWSDMFFRLDSDDGNSYYDTDSLSGGIIPGVDCVYWNYDGDKEIDKKMIRIHRRENAPVIFAGRIHTTGPLVNNKYAIKTITSSFEALREERVYEAFVTIWSNDGGETDYRYGLPALCAWAENSYSELPLNDEKIKARFEFLTSGDYEAFLKMSDFHNCFDDDRPLDSYLDITQGKRLLYQDIMLGFLDEYLSRYPLSDHYKDCALYMQAFANKNSKWHNHYYFAYVLFEIMYIKCRIGEGLKKAYESHNIKFLEDCANNYLPALSSKAREFHELYRKQWFDMKKAQGWEFLEMRLAHLYTRADSSAIRLKDYLSGNIDRLEELEEKRLKFPKFKYNYNEVATAYRP